jgi:hypothetical protein
MRPTKRLRRRQRQRDRRTAVMPGNNRRDRFRNRRDRNRDRRATSGCPDDNGGNGEGFVPRPHPRCRKASRSIRWATSSGCRRTSCWTSPSSCRSSEGVARARKQDVIFALLKVLTRHGEGVAADGVLEILPDGFGFLRAAEASYLAGPDDTYISPSQIRRFNLRTGDHICPAASAGRRTASATSPCHGRHHQRRAAGSVEEQGAVREPDPAVPAQGASSWNAATARPKTSPAASST